MTQTVKPIGISHAGSVKVNRFPSLYRTTGSGSGSGQIVKQQRRTRKVIAVSESAIIVLSRAAAKRLSVASSEMVSLTRLRTRNRPLSLSQAVLVSLGRATGKIISVSNAEAVTVNRTAGKGLSLAHSILATAAQLFQSGGAANHTQPITMSQGETVSLARNTGKRIAFSLFESATIVKRVAKAFAVSTAEFVTLSKKIGKTISLQSPTLTLIVLPPPIPSTTALGTTVATLQGVWSDGATFTGGFMFVAPNYDDDTYSVSGSDLIVSTNGPGVGSAGGTVQSVTIEAVQIELTADATISNAPAGDPLATSDGIWSWGPAQAGRLTGGGAFSGGTVLYLSGNQVGSADLIEVHHGGQLYANNAGSWFVWNGTAFVSSGAP